MHLEGLCYMTLTITSVKGPAQGLVSSTAITIQHSCHQPQCDIQLPALGPKIELFQRKIEKSTHPFSGLSRENFLLIFIKQNQLTLSNTGVEKQLSSSAVHSVWLRGVWSHFGHCTPGKKAKCKTPSLTTTNMD